MIHHEITGHGETLVFIHGFMENHKIWQDTIAELQSTHQILAVDLPGHGKSKNLRKVNEMEDFAEDIMEVLNFYQITKATFIGHSMGGYVSLAFAEVYPQFVDKLILVNSTSLADSAEKKEQRLKVIPTVERNFPLFVKLSIPMLFSDELKPQLQDEMNFLKKVALETSIEGVEAALKGMRIRPNRSSLLYDLNRPILIINAAKDTTIDVSLFETVIPNVPNIMVEKLDSGHVSFLERKAEFMAVIKKFLQ